MSSMQPENSTDPVHNNVINDEIKASVIAPETTVSDAPAEAENSTEETLPSSTEDIAKAYELYLQKYLEKGCTDDSESSSSSDLSIASSSSRKSVSSRQGVIQSFLYFVFSVKP